MHRVGLSYRRHPISEPYDVVVIGSGVGGLTAAVLLAKYAGKKVLVLEKHYVAGGFSHAFQRPGFDWDVGLHYVGDVLKPSENRRIFEAITGGRVEWASLGDAYERVLIGGQSFDYVAGRERFRQRMVGYFPGDRDAIDGYLRAVRDVATAVRGFYADKILPTSASRLVGPVLRRRFQGWSRRTVKEVMAGLTSDPLLTAVLTAQYGTYGLPPARGSFAMHALVADHYMEGAAYPVGGASAIPSALAAVLAEHGGRVLVNAGVAEIMVRGRRAVGVRLMDGVEVPARTIISDAGFVNTFGRLLPSEVGRPMLELLTRDVSPSAAHLGLYLGLSGTPTDLGHPKANLWVYRGADHDGAHAAFTADAEAPFPTVFISFPAARDPSFQDRHPGRSSIEVVALARPDWFAPWRATRWKKRGSDYDALKTRFTDRLLEEVDSHVPGTRARTEIAELSTPLTTRQFTSYENGEVYGLEHTPARFGKTELRPQTPIPGLYLTGQDVSTAGIIGAMVGGVLCASAITHRNLFSVR